MDTVLQAGRRAAHTTRISLWDNAKFVMIALVVIDHALATLRLDSELAFSIYTIPFFVHMPVMLIIAGYFAKPTVSRKSVRSVLQLLAAWVIWEVIWAGIRGVIAQSPPKETFLVSPAWTLWFLLTLATMRILLPYLLRLRYPLIISTAIALLAGCSTAIGPELSASRTLCFLPLFVAGWLLRDRGWLSAGWFMRPSMALRAAAWSVLGLAAIAVVIVATQTDWRIDLWLRWDEGYHALFAAAPLGESAPESFWSVAALGMLLRALLLTLSAALSCAALIVLPRSKMTLTAWGTRTLYVYLLHAPIIWLLRSNGVMDHLGELGGLGVLLAILLGITLAVLLSSRWVQTATRPLIEPRLRWLMGAKETAR